MLFNTPLTTSEPLRQAIREHYRCDEEHILNTLLPLAEIDAKSKSRAWDYARQLVINIRKEQVGKGGVDALLNEFSLSTEEGVVLMCLAEALLRVPDKETADSLIRDKLSQGDWSAHLGNSESLFVNASAWGLLLTGKLVRFTDKERQFGLLKQTMGRLGEPVIRKAVRYAMKIMGTQFVMGHTISEALERAKETEAKGYRYSYDMLGEGARTMADADRYFNSYMKAINAIGQAAKNRGPEKSPGISIKLSAIHPRYEFTHRERVINELIPRLKQLALAAKSYDIGFTVDAEEANRLDISLDIIEAVFSDNELAGWQGFGIAVQAYQRRALYVIEWVRELTQRIGRKMMVRLVKGAYWDSEIKDSQVEGYENYPVFTRKPSTDVSYQACAKKLLQYRDSIFPQFATHNAYTVATIIEMAKAGAEQLTGFEFQRLHGMGESLYDQVVCGLNIPCRVYAPVGEHSDLLAYLVRRLLENGANSSFVNNIVDDDIPVEDLLKDPVEIVQNWSQKANPQIPLPLHLYGQDRLNSKGQDLTDIDQLTVLKANMESWWQQTQQQTPADEQQLPVTNPANTDEVVGYIRHHTEEEMMAIVDNCQQAFTSWSATSVEHRANILRKTADLLEQHRDELIALCSKEAGKNIADCVAEVREAVDFCRYYAMQAEKLYQQSDIKARGVVLCISPWNFPLAIFLGQVAAALVAGNTVVAKPAEQTSLIAIKAVELLKQAGAIDGVIELAIARGSVVGKVIVPDERIQAVMFTGSTETGSWISQKLAERQGEPVPLIAETGGQNCMIVDSTALPEQVVDDVISSGFQSAGQRCSALRVLFVQEDVADKIITMIKGAMAELHIGDPSLLCTDVGPVIDEKAHRALTQHIEYLKDKATLHYECALNNLPEHHHFFAPRLYEIDHLSLLKKEVFGPIVHVIRYKARELEQVIQQINDTGYGLTMGIHTRIESKSRYLAARSRAGNIYINRNMIGAVVGVQPFGGRGLSGTGPKAGGPHYLMRLVKPAVEITTNERIASTPDYLKLFKGEQEHAFAVNGKMNKAQAAANVWQFKPLNERLSAVRQLLAKLSAGNIALDTDAEAIETAVAAARKQLLLVEQLLSKPTHLLGPTGESNTLYLEARGVLGCLYEANTSLSDWLSAVVTAIAAGNCIVLASTSTFKGDATQIAMALADITAEIGLLQSIQLEHLPTLLANEHLSGMIVAPNATLMGYVSQQVAARSGAILPTITMAQNRHFILRVVTEKTITIDTTAAGGNASLMTMSSNVN